MRRRSLLRSLAPFAVVAGGGGVLLAGCGGGSGGTPTPGPAPAAPPAPPAPTVRTFAYVANHTSGDIFTYQIDEAGTLTRTGSVQSGAGVRSFAIHPSNLFAYAVNELDDSISIYKVSPANGMLELNASFASGSAPGEIHIHPSGKFAYVNNLGDNTVSIYTIDLETGALDADEPPLQVFARPGSIAVHPSGAFLYVGRSDNLMSSYVVDPASGGLSDLNIRPTGLSPTKIAVAPSGEFLCAAHEDGAVSFHAINATGALAPASLVNAGDGARSVAIDPSSRFVYAATTVQDIGFSVSIFTVDTGGNGLRSAGTVRTPDTALNSLAVNPSGKFVYATNQVGDTVLAFTIQQETGAISELTPPTATGDEPAGITVVSITA